MSAERHATIPIQDDTSTGSQHSLAPTLDDVSSDGGPAKLSKRRWLVLAAMSVFGLAFSITYNTSPILHLMLKLLDFKIDKYLYIGQLFSYLMLVVAFPSAWFVDRYGIKVAALTASVLFVVTGLFRALLFSPDLPGWSHYKIVYWVISNVLGTELSAIYFLLPLKVSESWFSESERSFAWTFMVSQLEVGACISAFLYPRIMTEVGDVKFLAKLTIISVLVTAITCFICITRSEPKHAPNKRVARAAEDTTSFRISLMRMLKHRDIIIHLLHLAIFESAILTAGSALQDIFTSVGYSDIFSGDFMSIMAIVALTFQVLLACFAHRVKNLTFTCKFGSLIQGIMFFCYLATLLIGLPGWAVIGAAIVFNISKSWVTLNFTNMTAQLASGTVPQATIIGFLITLTVVTRIFIQNIFVSLIHIKGKRSFYGHALLFVAMVVLINDAIYLVSFRGDSRKDLEDRLMHEESSESR